MKVKCKLGLHKWENDTDCHRRCLKCGIYQTRYKDVCDDRPGYSKTDRDYYIKNIIRYYRERKGAYNQYENK